MFLEYLTNIYILPIIATIVGLAIVFIYDKFEKKQYTNGVYLRIGILIYISCFATIYISKLDILQQHSHQIQSGGSSINDMHSSAMMPQPNELKTHFEHFKTGVPTF